MSKRSACVLFGGALVLAACGGGAASPGESDGPAAINAPDTEQAESGEESGDAEESEQFESDRGRLGSEIAVSDTDPASYRGQIGTRIVYECPPEGTPSVIWGVEMYTDDSSVCSAAAHVGLLTLDEGGSVTIEIAEGQDEYATGRANDIDSVRYGSWGGSFFFPDAPPGSSEFGPTLISWTETARSGAVGDGFEVDCAPGGAPGNVWGTGTYTADSSICTAAVHAGLITIADGGVVTATVVDGLDEYEGTEANGIATTAYGTYGLSFTFE